MHINAYMSSISSNQCILVKKSAVECHIVCMQQVGACTPSEQRWQPSLCAERALVQVLFESLHRSRLGASGFWPPGVSAKKQLGFCWREVAKSLQDARKGLALKRVLRSLFENARTKGRSAQQLGSSHQKTPRPNGRGVCQAGWDGHRPKRRLVAAELAGTYPVHRIVLLPAHLGFSSPVSPRYYGH